MVAPLTAAGLILDIVGAVLVALALALKRPQDVSAESGSYYGYNPH